MLIVTWHHRLAFSMITEANHELARAFASQKGKPGSSIIGVIGEGQIIN